MRALFLSESRCISNLIKEKWGAAMESEPKVLKEYSAASSEDGRRPSFNRDFTIDFVDDFTEFEREGTMNTALPNTLGADLYLFVETPTLKPLHFELMFGDAFPIEYYTPYIERVESAVRDAVTRWQMVGGVASPMLLHQVRVAEAVCARFLVVGGDICFLYFPTEASPVMRGERFDLAMRDDRFIACHVTGDEILCFDGWIGSVIPDSDRMLVAEPETKR